MRTIGEKITMTREDLNLSQEQLAIRIRRSLNTIQQLETNQFTPDQDTIFQLSNALNIPVADLLDCCKKQNVVH